MTTQSADRQSSRGLILGKRQRVFFSPTKKVCQGTSTEVKGPGREADRSLNLLLRRRRMSKSVTPFPSLSEWGDDESQRHLHIENHRKHEDTDSGAGHVTLDVEHGVRPFCTQFQFMVMKASNNIHSLLFRPVTFHPNSRSLDK